MELLRNVDPALAAFVQLLTATIACINVQQAYGASASNLPGLLVIGPRSDFTVVNYAAALFHESIHQCLFLEHQAHGLFRRESDWQTPEVQVYSAIRRTRRPLDMTIHAACVAVGLSYFYHLCGEVNRANSYLEEVRKSLANIRDTNRKLRTRGRSYLTEHGEALLDEIQSFCDQPDYDAIARSLRSPVEESDARRGTRPFGLPLESTVH
jgi:HEXXH motif-containing protein